MCIFKGILKGCFDPLLFIPYLIGLAQETRLVAVRLSAFAFSLRYRSEKCQNCDFWGFGRWLFLHTSSIQLIDLYVIL